MIKRLTAGLAIVAFTAALGGTTSAATALPAPADWSVSSTHTLADPDMTHN